MSKVRLQRYLASAGLGSRRACEDFVRAGRVSVNGAPAELGQSVDPDSDRVAVDGRPVAGRTERHVIALNKPRGVLSTCQPGRETGVPVTDLVRVGTRLYPAGRLDRDSEGLLILTNDGSLAYRLTHPRFGKEKEYEVLLDAPLSATDLRRLSEGIELTDGPARAVRVARIGQRSVRLVLVIGRNRVLRRMFSELGRHVVSLRRVRVAGLRLGRLRPGQWRRLTDLEVDELLLQPEHA